MEVQLDQTHDFCLQSRNVCINNIPACSLPKSITAEKRLEVVMLEITSGRAPPIGMQPVEVHEVLPSQI